MPAAQRGGDTTVPATGDSLAGVPEGGGQANTASGSPQETPKPDKADGPPEGGKIRLATQGGLESVTVDDVIIGLDGADVDPQTAQRAHEAALRAGFKLREEKAANSGDQTAT